MKPFPIWTIMWAAWVVIVACVIWAVVAKAEDNPWNPATIAMDCAVIARGLEQTIEHKDQRGRAQIIAAQLDNTARVLWSMSYPYAPYELYYSRRIEAYGQKTATEFAAYYLEVCSGEPRPW